MTTEHIPESINRSADKHVYTISTESEHLNTSETVPPSLSIEDVPHRKRSNSVLQWMHKAFASRASHHDDSSSRRRASSIAHMDKQKTRVKPPPISYTTNGAGRARSNTTSSTGSRSNRMPIQKKIISDTDERAQQAPSLFQFALGR